MKKCCGEVLLGRVVEKCWERVLLGSVRVCGEVLIVEVF